MLALDPGGRGIRAFSRPGAARDAARALRRARRVLITTGFTVADGMPETDGPPGAAVLGRALRRLGARVCYVTDPVTVPLLGATLSALGEPREIETYPEGDGAARAVLARERPTHLVAIERPSRSRSGDYLSARGESVAAWNRPLDELFVCSGVREAGSHRGWPERGAAWRRRAPERGATRRGRATTIGVGDGGNEIGMGNVRAKLVRQGALLARIASVVRVDHLVVAGTSNWGAYGIVAALGLLAGQDLLHTGALERRLVEACVEAGAFDGVTRRGEPTVDGLPLDVHAAVVELLRHASGAGRTPANR
ncbi:MAG: DUF4392 domain-containing protein [Candidatus Rokubacteria bacterium]|nr:DUF4392 domain-containing protein [Candidatus Rokubacteria bacterium]